MSSSLEHKDFFKGILLHLLIGFVIFNFKILSIGYSALILMIGVLSIVKTKNKDNRALLFAGYIVCAEVFLRMTKGNIGNEFGKYCVIIFLVLGAFYDGIQKKSIYFWFFLFLLLPGIIIGVTSLGYEANIRKALVFNLLGAFTLGISSICLIDKKFEFNDFDKLTKWMLYPLIAMLVYLFLFNPNIRDVVTGTDSNSATSGGFGPNQVSTILGLGMFLAFLRLLFFSKSKLLMLIHFSLLLLFSFRGIITFSRGGVYTGLAMIIVLLVVVYPFLNFNAKMKVNVATVFFIFIGIGVFSYSVTQTGGMISNRYKGQDALGRDKASKFSGREELASQEWQMFIENPFLGIGVGKNKEYREEMIGVQGASHNEMTRMLAEHGMFGVFGLLLLFVLPVLSFWNNRKHIFLFSFFIFWLLTINHAAMRIAAPAFIYALSLLKVNFSTENHD